MKNLANVPSTIVTHVKFNDVLAAMKTAHAKKLLNATKHAIEENDPRAFNADIVEVMVESLNVGHVREVGGLLLWMKTKNVVIDI